MAKKIRIYELAKELECSSQAILDFLEVLGSPKKSPLAGLDPDLVEQIRKGIEPFLVSWEKEQQKKREEEFLAASSKPEYRNNQESEIKKLIQLAESGNLEAIFILALELQKEKNWNAAFQWLKKGALKGHGPCQYQLALCYREGWGTSQKPEDYLLWIGQAASQGVPQAMVHLARLYEEPEVVCPHLDKISLPSKIGTLPNLNKAMEWYEKAEEKGVPLASFHLARLAWKNRDFKKARMYLEKLVSTNDKEALWRLGILDLYGWAGEKNLSKSQEYLEQAWKEGSPQACFGMGMVKIEEGDSEKAALFFEEGAERGHIPSLVKYLEWLISQNKLEEALKWEHQEMVTSSPLVFFLFGKIYELQENYEKSRPYYEKAWEAGVEEAGLPLAHMLERGQGGAKDEKRAFQIYQKLAQKDNLNGIYHLARCYEEEVGTGSDPEKAFSLYEDGAHEGHGLCQMALGYCYSHGIGTQKDLEKAIYWYEKAYEQGHWEAAFNLGLAYEKKEEYEKAREWYAKGAEHGD
ncbi:MAG: hypothetical protein D6785_08595, partial [Planctomycetota bacterium]